MLYPAELRGHDGGLLKVPGRDCSIFSQVAEWAPHYEFQRLVAHYKGDYKASSFHCWDQFLCMMFAQLTYRDSLRDIESCLRARSSLLYHMGS